MTILASLWAGLNPKALKANDVARLKLCLLSRGSQVRVLPRLPKLQSNQRRISEQVWRPAGIKATCSTFWPVCGQNEAERQGRTALKVRLWCSRCCLDAAKSADQAMPQSTEMHRGNKLWGQTRLQTREGSG